MSIRFIINFSGIAKEPNSTRLLINQVLKALQMRTLLKRQVTHEDQRLKSVKLAICPFGIIKMYFWKRRNDKKKRKNHGTSCFHQTKTNIKVGVGISNSLWFCKTEFYNVAESVKLTDLIQSPLKPTKKSISFSFTGLDLAVGSCSLWTTSV